MKEGRNTTVTVLVNYLTIYIAPLPTRDTNHRRFRLYAIKRRSNKMGWQKRGREIERDRETETERGRDRHDRIRDRQWSRCWEADISGVGAACTNGMNLPQQIFCAGSWMSSPVEQLSRYVMQSGESGQYTAAHKTPEQRYRVWQNLTPTSVQFSWLKGWESAIFYQGPNPRRNCRQAFIVALPLDSWVRRGLVVSVLNCQMLSEGST